MSRKTKKLIWAAPLVAVFAVAAALAIFAAQPADPAEAHGPPGVVGNLTGSADGQNQIDLSWDAPAMGGTPTSYRIDRSEDGNTWMAHVTGHTMRTYSDMGLDPASTYYYRVFAVNSAGSGPVSPDYQVQTDPGMAPSAVIQLRATAMGQNQINLTWKAPAKLNGSPVEKYFIHFGFGSHDDNAIPGPSENAENSRVFEVAAEDGMSYEHKKLKAATRYKYIVYAENDTGKSTVPSNTAAATTAVLVKPSAPTGLVASQVGSAEDSSTFSLYWHAPANNGGINPIDYDVEASYNGNQFAPVTTTFTDSATVSRDTTVTVPSTFDHDGNTNTAEQTVTSVAFRVYAVTRRDNAATVGINEELKSDGYASTRSVPILAVADLPIRVPDAPSTPEKSATRDSKGNVNLTWTAPDTDPADEASADDPPSIGGYRIDVSDDGINWRGLVHHTRKTDTKYQYVDTERKNRSYRIFAWHAQYLGAAQEPVLTSQLVTATVTAPSHVRSFTATPVGPSQIDLSWRAPASDGNADIVLYLIDGMRQKTDGSFDGFRALTFLPSSLPTASSGVGTVRATSKTLGYMHKKLNAGETWQYRVLAVTNDESEANNIRTSAAGSAETRTATTFQADLPEAPEGLVAEDAKDSSLTGAADRGVLLLWNAPDPLDGANIDGYRIERKKGAAAWETLVMDTNNVFTDYTDASEPAAGEMRAYRVAALNGNKMGAYAMAYYPVQAHTHVAATGTLPAQTVHVGATATVDASSGFTGDGLTYSVMSSDSAVATATVGAMSGSVTITGVGAGSATITVTATDAGMMTDTQTIAVTVPAPVAATGTLAAQTVNVGATATVDASTGFTGVGLTYSVMSSDATVATATVVASTGSVTITGVGAGSADITVTATDAGMATATQPIAVTVPPVDTSLGRPTNVSTCVAGDPGCSDLTAGQVQVTWTNGKNAVAHVAGLLQGTTLVHIATAQTDGTATFTNVMPGTYLVGVAAFDSDFNLMIGVADAPLIVQ